ncbi:MAG: endonuclease V [Acidobacteriota bacterium]
MNPIVCFDVHYRESWARAAAVGIESWEDGTPSFERTQTFEGVASYVPGQFYRRELPLILGLLHSLRADSIEPALLVIDGYVWLGDEESPGLGGHLWNALDRRAPVVGVAKNTMTIAAPCQAITRGRSTRPLFVSSAGIPTDRAARHVERMAGDSRFPAVLKRVDRLCRDGRLAR